MDIDPAALQNREAGAALNRDVQHVWNPQAVTELGTEEDQGVQHARDPHYRL